MQHSIRERILKIGLLVFEFIHYKQKYKFFSLYDIKEININIDIYLHKRRIDKKVEIKRNVSHCNHVIAFYLPLEVNI